MDAENQTPATEAATNEDATAAGAEPGKRQPCPCGSGKKLKNCCGDAEAAQAKAAANASKPELGAGGKPKPLPPGRPGGHSGKSHFPQHQQKNLPAGGKAKTSHTRKV